MELFIILLQPLALMTVVVAALYTIVTGRWQDVPQADDPGIGTVKRLYFYTVTFVGVMMAGNGLAQILRHVLDGLFGVDVLASSSTELAVGASLTLVGLPIWAYHWRLLQRHVAELPVERRSVIRKSYIYLVLWVSVSLTATSATNLLQWILGAGSFDGYDWAAVIVWTIVWAFHWSLESKEGQTTKETRAIRRLYIYLVSMTSLAVVAIGLGRTIHIIFLEGYGSLVDIRVLLPSETGLWAASMRDMLASALVGSGIWGSHWLCFARRDFGSILRQLYLYGAVLGGVFTMVVSTGIILFGVLLWLLGVPIDETAPNHFRFLPGALASLSIGAGLWAYHWSTIQREAKVSLYEPQGARRSYVHILAALGLGALAISIVTLATTTIGILTESGQYIIAGPAIWRNQIVLAITLAVLGGPLWSYYWFWPQRQVIIGDYNERSALARRIFIFAVLAAGALVLLGSVSFLLFVLIRDLLETNLALETVRDTKVAVGIILAAGIFVPYYWIVYQQDRRSMPGATVAVERLGRKKVSLLIREGDTAFIGKLEAALGYKVCIFAWADADASSPNLSEVEFCDMARLVSGAPGKYVLLIPEDAGLRLLSYD